MACEISRSSQLSGTIISVQTAYRPQTVGAAHQCEGPGPHFNTFAESANQAHRPVVRPRAEGGQSCLNVGPKDTPQQIFPYKICCTKKIHFSLWYPLVNITLGFCLSRGRKTENLKIFLVLRRRLERKYNCLHFFETNAPVYFKVMFLGGSV